MWDLVGRSRKSDDFSIGGLRVWEHEWQPLQHEAAEQPARVWDPVYGRVVEIRGYKITDGQREVIFAAAEITSGSWLFCQRALPGCCPAPKPRPAR